MDAEAEIRKIQDEIKRTQYNKATEHHIGLLKAKIARLKVAAASKRKAGSGKGFAVRKEGDATAVMVGYPSVGKSTLLNKLTEAKSRVAAYEFTTTETIPGVLEYGGAKIQLLDVPGLITGAAEGKGRGREVISAVRSADLILILADVTATDTIVRMINELEAAGIRLDKRPSQVSIEKMKSGGLSISGKSGIPEETLKEIFKTFGILNANVIFKESLTVDSLIDFLSRNCVYAPSLIVLNKMDRMDRKQAEAIREGVKTAYGKGTILISAEHDINLEELRKRIYEKMKFIQVFTRRKEAKEIPKEPIILKEGATIRDVCNKIHRDMYKEFKYALVTGRSTKFPNQRVGLDHIVKEGDVVRIVSR